jgi:hypothetical protein
MRVTGQVTGAIRGKIQSAAMFAALLSGFAAAAHATATVSPSSLDFGAQTAGTSSTPMAVTVTNTTRNKIKIVSASASQSAFSYSGPSLPITLNQGQAFTGVVIFKPTAAQSYSGTLSFIRTNGSTITVQLSGTGIALQPSGTSPAISTQPVSQTVIGGQTATFSVTASGTGPLGYQWRKGGIAISGATLSAYTTPAETTSDSGAQFSVVVSNTWGSVTSNAATLTVNAATFLLSASPTSLSFGNVNTSSSSTLIVTFKNSGNSSVTISNVSISGAGFSCIGLPAGTILSPGQAGSLNVTFAPAATGSVAGSVTVASNATNSPAVVALSGAGVQLVSHSATVNWNASTSAVIGYNVYRGSVSGGPYQKINASPDAATSFTDSTVQAGQIYYWVVTAVTSSNAESAYSSQVSATIPTP